MSGLLEEQKAAGALRLPGEGKRACIIGAPCGFGAGIAGVDLGPAAMRVARLRQRVEGLGYEVRDKGDLRVECPSEPPPAGERLRFLKEIKAACEQLAKEVRQSLEVGELPVVLGGDHSIAVGTVSGVASFYRQRKEPV